jgi:hypothetical protein
MSDARGLKISGTNFRYLDKGAYATIFVDEGQNTVRKVYRAERGRDRDHCEQVFRSERDAYQIASEAEELRHLVPTYFGTRTIERILDLRDTDVTGEFYSDLSIEIEYIASHFSKISTMGEPERTRIIELFGRHGIRHMSDASVSTEGERVRKVIDFSVREVEYWHPLA